MASTIKDNFFNRTMTLVAAAAGAMAAFGGTVSEVAVLSASMNRKIPASVVLPDRYAADSTNRWPVVYLLHGAGGSNRRYIDAGLGLPSLSDRFGVIIVCADGGNTS